jgi:predicted nucleic acid-binding protein
VAYRIDTSVLARLVNAADGQHSTAVRAVVELHRRGEVLHVTPQNLVEFRSVATRPTNMNGLGLTGLDARTAASGFEASFPLLEETPAIYPTWKALVERLNVLGKQVHDARLIAVCHVHGIQQLLTFNTAHLARLASFEPGLNVVDPKSV